jgi:hypothetical protein
MDVLPDDVLEAVIRHLVETDTKPTQNNPTGLRQQRQRRDGTQEDDSGCIFDFSAFMTVVTHSFIKIVEPHPAIVNINIPTYISNILLRIQGKPSADPIYDARYADLFNARLTCRFLLSAASPSFLAHIESQPWNLNTRSITRLSKLLLLNPDLAHQIARLRFTSYRFDSTSVAHNGYDTHQDLLSFTKAVESRTAYVKEKLIAQLVNVFRHTRNLEHLIVTPELLHTTNDQNMLYPAQLDFFTRIAQISDPIQALAHALEISCVNTKLVSYTSYTAVDYCLSDSATSTMRLVCNNLTHLSIDSAYFMDSPLALDCPSLVSLEIVRIERLPVHRLNKFLHRKVEEEEHQQRRNMYGRLRHLLFTGALDPRNTKDAKSTSTLYTSTIYALLAHVAQYTRHLETLTIRRARIHSDVQDPGSERIAIDMAEINTCTHNDAYPLEDLSIGKLRVQGLEYRDSHWSGWKSIGSVEDVREQLDLLQGCVEEMVIISDEKCTCSWERGAHLCQACQASLKTGAEVDRQAQELEQEWEDALVNL